MIYEKTDTGYSCYVRDLPGCIAADDDLAQTKNLMRRAIEVHLARMRKDGLPIQILPPAAEYLETPVA
jgi:predicted RNase H-like HicB family nuclease